LLRLRVVQAEFGDCLILEYGTRRQPRYWLIDGGPSGTYAKALKGELAAIHAAGGCLERVVLSHVDNDHIIGLLELFAEVAATREAGLPDPIAVGGLWHNRFTATLGSSPLAAEIETTFSQPSFSSGLLPFASEVVFGIREGHQLSLAQQELGYPLNPEFGGELILAGSPPLSVGGMKVWVIGPSQANLQRLEKDWRAWLKKAGERGPYADEAERDKIDRSVPNLSSIMFLAQAGSRRILLTGDGTGDDVITGLQATGLLQPGQRFAVDILKLPHHGSARNASPRFFETVTARTYLISANGRYNNPDLATLIWLVEAGSRQNRKVVLVATNPTEATDQLLAEYPPERFGYRLVVMPESQTAIVL
jgi:hypothetical protein